ncbi:MAG: hypothetical protein ACRD9W_16405, partial [Terriglobia bacterium]
MSERLRYHQMLVSPYVGGGAKLAIELHSYAVATRGPVSGLLLPLGAEAERAALERRAPFTDYRLDRLMSANRLCAGLENLRLYCKLYRHGAGTIHVHSPFVYAAARPFIGAARLKSILHIHLAFNTEQLQWPLRAPPNLIIVCAEFMRPAVEAALPALRATRTRVRVILNAIDTARFFPADHRAAKVKLGIPQDMP